MSSNTVWKMPKVQIGDCVLFSSDMDNFSKPAVGWVTREPGDSTVHILVFTNNGFVEKPSVHHKDDPAIHEDHGWQSLGCWDYAPQTRAIYGLNTMLEPVLVQEVSVERELAAR